MTAAGWFLVMLLLVPVLVAVCALDQRARTARPSLKVAGLITRPDGRIHLDVARFRAGEPPERLQFTGDPTTMLVWRHYPSGERARLELEIELEEVAKAYLEQIANSGDGR